MSALTEPRAAADPDRVLEDLYRRYEHDVYRFALGLVDSREEAEDVTQTTFLNAYRALSRGNAPRKPRAWLLAIAENVCRHAFRARARGPALAGVDPEVVEAKTDADAPTAAQIRSAVKRLPLSQSAVILLRECRGLTYAEIAHRLGLTLPAVETVLFRARRALRAELERIDATPSAVPARTRRRRLGGLIPFPDFGRLLGWLSSADRTGLAANLPALVAAVIGTGLAVGTGALHPVQPGAASPRFVADRAVQARTAAATTGSDRTIRLLRGRRTLDRLGVQRGRVDDEGFREDGTRHSMPPQTGVRGETQAPSAAPEIQSAVRMEEVLMELPSPPLLEPPAPLVPALETPSLPEPPSLPLPPAAEPQLPSEPPPLPIDLP